jgi:hypothetical protein
VIAYLPGYGGNFLNALFSLDPNTLPLWHIDGADDPVNRAQSFLQNIDNQKIFALNVRPPKAVDSDQRYRYHVEATHPEEFDFDHLPDRVLQAELSWSDWANYWLMRSKENFDYKLARLRPDEIKKNARIRKIHDVFTVKVDDFLDPMRWLSEYARVNATLSLANHIEAARLMHNFWWQLRVADLAREFKELKPTQYANYCYARLQEEVHGTPSAWQTFYERVRDPAWPDCDQEKDFEQLPDWIQQELVDKFHYQPAT